jgi:quercetin dioxygenase-like cupin family protein
VKIAGPRLILALAATSLIGAGAAALVIAQTSGAPTAKREALAQSTKPKGAKGRTLGLSKVVIPAGAQLALHRHAGTQIARVVSGTLTYTVRNGKVRVRRGPAEDPTFVRTIKAGQTGKIGAGQWIVEQPSDIHMAANNSKGKIVIYLATLLRTGAPPSTPVD